MFIAFLTFSLSAFGADLNYLNSQIAGSRNDALDYVIQDVCVDANDLPIAGDPAYCPSHRNIRIGEKVPYLITDMNTVSGDRYQAIFSYPVPGVDGSLKAIVPKHMQGGYNPSFTFSYNDNHDGFDLLDLSGGYVSGIRTSDPGCFDQIISANQYQRQHGWIFFATGMYSSNVNHGTRIDRISPSIPGHCQRTTQNTDNSARAVWDMNQNMTYESGKVLNSIVSYHFANYNFSQTNNALERFYFTREYGFTRWEAWIPRNRCYQEGHWFCNDPDLNLRGRCGSNGVADWGGQIWVRMDCRDNTFYQSINTPFIPLDSQMAQNHGVVDINSSQVLYFLTAENHVRAAYQNVLDRAADPSGLATYTNLMAVHGWTRENVIHNIAYGSEALYHINMQYLAQLNRLPSNLELQQAQYDLATSAKTLAQIKSELVQRGNLQKAALLNVINLILQE